MTLDLVTGRAYPSVEALNHAQKLYGLRCLKYTPDFEADLGGTKMIVEVKHSELINRHPMVLEYPGILARYRYCLIILLAGSQNTRSRSMIFISGFCDSSMPRSTAPLPMAHVASMTRPAEGQRFQA
ncbi:hypothetical protein [Poseidonocella sedimentorum]|uniref:hypothetical protein n=1 Tax=Poseidonocella sedimentorum TaxID=871652 RepID=UPI001C430BF7|nr:hypothetical protein [Poseidonocella sedimentorum]